MVFFIVCRFDQLIKPETQSDDDIPGSNPAHNNLMHILGLGPPRTANTATQTGVNVRRTASTQTEQATAESPTRGVERT